HSTLCHRRARPALPPANPYHSVKPDPPPRSPDGSRLTKEVVAGVTGADHIRSTVRMPSSDSPRWITRPVRSHSNSRLRRSSGVSALSTGQFWKKLLKPLDSSHRYEVIAWG